MSVTLRAALTVALATKVVSPTVILLNVEDTFTVFSVESTFIFVVLAVTITLAILYTPYADVDTVTVISAPPPAPIVTSSNWIVSAALYNVPLLIMSMFVTPPAVTCTLNVAPVPSPLLIPVTV